MHLARVHFASTETTGFLHPSGDGYRTLLAFPENDGVYAFYAPILDGAFYTQAVWATFWAEVTEIGAPDLLRTWMLRQRDMFSRQGVPFDRERTDTVLALLAAKSAPAPRIRVRSPRVA